MKGKPSHKDNKKVTKTIHMKHLAHSLFGTGDRPCVWMEAGLVSYKICDHDQECATCPLDMAMGGRRRTKKTSRAPESTHRTRWSFPQDRLYHHRHCWVMPTSRNTLRCGIDAFAASLFPDICGVVLPGNRANLIEGAVSSWICMGEGLILPLCSPADGAVMRRNPLLASTPAAIIEQPYGEGWLFELSGEMPRIGRNTGLRHGGDMHRQAEVERVALRQRLEAEVSRDYPELNRVAADGGEISPRIVHEIGAESYKQIVGPFIY
jgi:glycine cleavage system H lipoate-binding protein